MPTSIETLDLSGNKFTDGIPSEWGLLTKLKNLKVFDCGLDGACVFRDVHKYRHRSNITFSRAGPLPKLMPSSLETLELSGSLMSPHKFTGGIPAEWGSRPRAKAI